MNPFWDEATARTLFEAIGEDGRAAYKAMYDNFLGDMLLPILYSICMACALFNLQPKRRWLCFIALLTGVFDLGENICIRNLLESWPLFN